MRILILADIHGNWPALQAIDEPHDLCLFLGDLVDYNLEPAPCIDWVRKNAHHAVRGNHDHGVAQHIKVTGRSGYRYLTSVTRPLTQDILSPEDRRFLGRLPVSRMVTLGDLRFLLVHASPRDPLDEFNIPDPDFWRLRLQDIDADVICVGHTHHPYILEVDGKLIVNPGSVGQPRDGDPRASYAVIEDNRVQLKRAEYPIEQTIETILQSALPEPAKALLTQVLRSGAMPRPSSSSTHQQPGSNQRPPDGAAPGAGEAASG